MKIFVKTLKGTHFEIQVNPDDKVVDVKKNIEALQGESVYPAESQMLIHQGKILKDETTVEENKVSENSFIVIMLNKAKGSSSGASTTAKASTTVKTPSNQPSPANTVPANPSTPVSVSLPLPASTLSPVPTSAPTPTATAEPSPAVTVTTETDVYGQAASNLVAGSNFEQTIQYILDMGGGTWNRDTVAHALRAAFNNPERAVEYLYSVEISKMIMGQHFKDVLSRDQMFIGIPENAAVPPVAEIPAEVQTVTPPSQVVRPPQPAVPSSGPNANPLDLFPQGIPNMGPNAGGAGNLDFLRNSPQFRYLQAMVQNNPQILQPMLQELGKQNPNVMRLIQEHQAEFLRLINEPAEGGEGWPEGNSEQGQLPAGLPQQITVTPDEAEAIERLEAMGFDRALVLEVFVACNRNEELAANYLLDHMHEFEE